MKLKDLLDVEYQHKFDKMMESNLDDRSDTGDSHKFAGNIFMKSDMTISICMQKLNDYEPKFTCMIERVQVITGEFSINVKVIYD